MLYTHWTIIVSFKCAFLLMPLKIHLYPSFIIKCILVDVFVLFWTIRDFCFCKRLNLFFYRFFFAIPLWSYFVSSKILSCTWKCVFFFKTNKSYSAPVWIEKNLKRTSVVGFGAKAGEDVFRKLQQNVR